jgi:hypothetical protein
MPSPLPPLSYGLCHGDSQRHHANTLPGRMNPVCQQRRDRRAVGLDHQGRPCEPSMTTCGLAMCPHEAQLPDP